MKNVEAKNYYSYQPALHFKLVVGKAVTVKGAVTQSVSDFGHKSPSSAKGSLGLNTGSLNTFQCCQQLLEPVCQVAGFAGQPHLGRDICGGLLLPQPNALQVLSELSSQFLRIAELRLELIGPPLRLRLQLRLQILCGGCLWLWEQPGAEAFHLASKVSKLEKAIAGIVLQRVNEEAQAGQELDVLPLLIPPL